MCMPKLPPASPPNESILLVFTVLFAAITLSPGIDKIDEIAIVQTISTPLFPNIVSKRTLGLARLSLAVIFFLATCYRIFTRGYVMRTNYLQRSKLKTLPINLDGIKSQVMFTSWCCNLSTLSLTINGIVTLLSLHDSSNDNVKLLQTIFFHRWMLRFAIIIFVIAAPTSMLIAFVVRYALWPQAIRGVNGSIGLRRPVALIQHNLNIFASLMEIGVLGKIPIRISEIALPALWGVLYIGFTWFITHRLVESGEPQFVYFFMDTTLGARMNCLILTSLIVVLMTFFVLFSIIDDFLLHLGGGVIFNTTAVILISSSCCRFRD